jgi:hypothetical protein
MVNLKFSIRATYPTKLTMLYLISLTLSGKKYKLWNLLLHICLPPSAKSVIVGSILLYTSQTPAIDLREAARPVTTEGFHSALSLF